MAYTKKTWADGEVITKDALNNIENGIHANDGKNTNQDSKLTELESKVVKATSAKDGLMPKEDKAKLDGIAERANNYTLPQATKTAFGGVKQAALVPDAATEQVTKAEFNALLSSLKTAGIMSNS